ncbi:MAG: hypothetical protein COS39_02415 [Hydrogenophilales bacterium CG03_land_8_20_14_0_80_62_28]|nr:hypothetical protein [Betaproteobacteria bacterium]OIO78232.1 MAG: hypothetical protein AUJ86_06095 [Hydrogenophilaceae bacterium CG1_02_62_390]PIV24000.1 MAG: hypothetical protein COS39_02415 [Hydrogenophilales bacterium CG03_land_8_20_14_0_80_62_28]PIW39248.1 MAG: hypothetical protein COW23_02520 [Hydrogenophilales bacterium CG15_BIG_FIL_POST_REV_8_21_14_020_62_31]PIW71944.1 MAG: hypothetical protein COW07_05645 [Hydrogenophilales bacterium CG12_big_fil_rev_8_21_14_0_65_61_21]PIX01415.1 M
MREIIHLQREAPCKPAEGATCNGCGVCCALETCPVACLLYWRRRGPCPALLWSPRQSRYLCGLLTLPDQHLALLPRIAGKLARPLVARWISAGSGCDCTVELTGRPTTRK